MALTQAQIAARKAAEKAARKAGITSKPKTENKYARIGCAYGECKATFLPNGVGSLQHTTCSFGRMALKTAKAARKAA